MHCCRFSVKVTALWEEGSNADVALDDIAVGAACFNRGKLLALGHHRFLEEKNNISIQFRHKNAHLSDAQMKDEIKKKKNSSYYVLQNLGGLSCELHYICQIKSEWLYLKL